MNGIDPVSLPDLNRLARRLEAEQRILDAEANNRSMPPVPGRVRPGAQNAGCSTSTCKGVLSIGLFFDGTSNNELLDYGPPGNPKPLRNQKHTNVVRLYHVFPGKKDEEAAQDKNAVDRIYKFYAPGVGTPFPEIGDEGGSLGSSTAWFGEPRILWGIVQVLNAIHRYYLRGDLINPKEIPALLKELSNDYLLDQMQDFVDDLWTKEGEDKLERHHAHRRSKFGEWIKKLKSAISPKARPSIAKINLYVFGFSRGAAEARVFINWLLELCEPGQKLAGIPLEIPFMGIFDTVASVGVAGLYAFSEGRQGWAENNLQIPAAVRKCVHIVGAHEVRACFPLDSVRVEAKYPANTREILYPGAHSDIGGGYLPQALGKKDWANTEKFQDLQLARLPCFDMYCLALEAGVPFLSVESLVQQRRLSQAKALLPSVKTLQAVQRYLAEAKVKNAPLEDMTRAHMAQYHAWRWKMGLDGLEKSGEFQRLQLRRAATDGVDDEEKWIRATQQALIQVVAAYCQEIDSRMSATEYDHRTPLKNRLRPIEQNKVRLSVVAISAVGAPLSLIGSAAALVLERKKLLTKRLNKAIEISRNAPQKLEAWRQWLLLHDTAEWHDANAPEREAIWLLDAVSTAKNQPDSIGTFFSEHIHDSMAGFIGFNMPEFEFNGYGIAKFRRIFFGNSGDKILRDRVMAENENRQSVAFKNRPPSSTYSVPSNVGIDTIFNGPWQ
jgi:hypothetical protein